MKRKYSTLDIYSWGVAMECVESYWEDKYESCYFGQ